MHAQKTAGATVAQWRTAAVQLYCSAAVNASAWLQNAGATNRSQDNNSVLRLLLGDGVASTSRSGMLAEVFEAVTDFSLRGNDGDVDHHVGRVVGRAEALFTIDAEDILMMAHAYARIVVNAPAAVPVAIEMRLEGGLRTATAAHGGTNNRKRPASAPHADAPQARRLKHDGPGATACTPGTFWN